MSGYFSGSFHNLFHSKADSVSKVKDIALSAVSQIVHSQNMCLSEVIDMDIIPYAGAIFCIIIRTENGNILSLVVRYLKNQRDQMCFRIMSLTNFSIRMRATGIKVAQGNIS